MERLTRYNMVGVFEDGVYKTQFCRPEMDDADHDDCEDEVFFDDIIDGVRITIYHRDDNDTWYAFCGTRRTFNHKHLLEMMKDIIHITDIDSDILEELEADIDYEYDKRREEERRQCLAYRALQRSSASQF